VAWLQIVYFDDLYLCHGYDSDDPLHFGNFMGLTSKIVYFFFGLTLVTMSITGIWMWKNRNQKRKTRGLEQARLGLWKPVSISILGLGIGSGLITIFSIPYEPPIFLR